MSSTATLSYGDHQIELPLVTGSEQEQAIDISRLRANTGLITLDDGFGNTGSCKSDITFINGEQGVLRYRGYDIADLAVNCTFVETAYLLNFGELPTQDQLTEFRRLLTQHQFLHEDLHKHFDGFPANAPPMAILSAMINAAGCFEPALREPDDDDHFIEAAARLMSKIRTIAAASYCKSIGKPINYPRSDLRYTANFLHMLFSEPFKLYEPHPDVVQALDQLLILHADHEQNCSTSTVRMVGSSRANMYASVAAGVCALWGPLHGGANVAVIEMLERIQNSGDSMASYVEKVKQRVAGVRLMGFGHRVYKNFDPRAKLIKQACHTTLERLGIQDPLLDLAMELEQIALNDDYFVERKLYPNVDFYSGIIMRAIGIPSSMFTVIFAMGRLPGWTAHWREVRLGENNKIYRPRQIYTGSTQRDYVPIDQR